jgi:hypothetical protein
LGSKNYLELFAHHTSRAPVWNEGSIPFTRSIDYQ